MIDPIIGWVNGKPRLRKLTASERVAVIQHLTHRKSRMRWMAADLLGKQCALETIEPLVQALHDPHWLVRLHAAKALGRIGHPQAFDALRATLSDEHVSVRRHAIRALGQLPDERVIAEVLRVFQHEPALRNAVADSLTHFVTSHAADALMRATTNPVNLLSAGLAVKVSQVFTPVLLVLLTFPSEAWQSKIVKLLGQIGDQRSIPALRIHSATTRSRFQHAAYRALGQVQYRYYERMIPCAMKG